MKRVQRMSPVLGAVALLLVIAGCSSGPPAAPARAAVGKPVHYVALGGDDVYGGRRRFATSWTQRFFRDHLPVNATMVNLASPHHGGAEIREDELPTAIRLHPDIVTITLIDDLERATAPETVQRDLSAIIRSLRRVPGVRILVGTAPLDTDTDTVRSAYNAAITAAVRIGGVELIDLSRVSATDENLRAQQIADAFARGVARRP